MQDQSYFTEHMHTLFIRIKVAFVHLDLYHCKCNTFHLYSSTYSNSIIRDKSCCNDPMSVYTCEIHVQLKGERVHASHPLHGEYIIVAMELKSSYLSLVSTPKLSVATASIQMKSTKVQNLSTVHTLIHAHIQHAYTHTYTRHKFLCQLCTLALLMPCNYM